MTFKRHLLGTVSLVALVCHFWRARVVDEAREAGTRETPDK